VATEPWITLEFSTKSKTKSLNSKKKSKISKKGSEDPPREKSSLKMKSSD
jgi:hypothetical protein